MNQVSTTKGKSELKSSSGNSPRVSLATDTVHHTPRQSPSHSNLSTPLTDSPQTFAFDRVIGKVLNENLIVSLTIIDAVLKEVKDRIIRDDEDWLL